MTLSRRNCLAFTSAAAVLMLAGGVGATAAEPSKALQLPPLAERVKTHEALRLLAELGYEPGVVDRMMTANIAGAIREFQRSRNLPVDGRVTDELLAALRDARR